MEYEAWKAGQPNHSGDCVHFRYFFWQKQAYWYDVPCSEMNRPICGKIITVQNHLSFFWLGLYEKNQQIHLNDVSIMISQMLSSISTFLRQSSEKLMFCSLGSL